MKDDRCAPSSPAVGGRRSDLMLRVASAVALAPVAIGAVIFGGWTFVLFWTLAAVGVQWEWSDVTGGAVVPRLVGFVAVAAAGLLAGAGKAETALLVLFAALVIAAILPGRGRAWALTGIVYAGTVVIAPVLLRRDAEFGLLALIFLFAVVWASDIAAFFAGRLIGGPKLAPVISPNKTWSGAIGGALGAVAAGGAVAVAAGLANPLAVVCLALLLSAVSQAGDLFESGIKRHFGVKDSSRLIPGHGGLMDRLDGFLAAACVAALFGVARGGLDGAARGLLAW